jgi:IS4 transposase
MLFSAYFDFLCVPLRVLFCPGLSRQLPLEADEAAYTFLLTTLPEDWTDDEKTAEFYRLRWQIELLFKHLKSLLSLDVLRAKNQALARSYLLEN